MTSRAQITLVRGRNHSENLTSSAKLSRTCPDVQFKEFSLTKQKNLDQEWPMSELRKPFSKKSDQKIRKKQKINVKKPHVNKKPLARNEISFQTKTRPRMSWEWIGKTI